MYPISPGYQDVQQNPSRYEKVALSLGLYIDDTAQEDVQEVTGEFLPMSNPLQIVDTNYGMTYREAVFEGDGIPTAMSCVAPPLEAQPYPPEIGLWSEDISDGTGAIDWTVDIDLGETHTSALSIYTEGPNIVEGEVTFHLTDAEDDVVELDCAVGRAVASGAHTYDSITIHITKIDDVHKHVRLLEVDFGDSVSISPSTIGNTISIVEEIDPLWQGMPMSELDLDLINVYGEYDEDNPSTLYDRLAIGYPINASFTLSDGEHRYTVPVGRYYIGAKRTNGNFLTVTAYDTRWQLSRMMYEWEISTEEDLGTSLSGILERAGVPFLINDEVYEITPYTSFAFNDQTTVLDDLAVVAQAYGLSFIPTRQGTIEVSVGFPSDEYGNVLITSMFTWAETSQINRYNFIDVAYYGESSASSGHYTIDLREEPMTTSKQVIAVNNRTINSQAHAKEVAERIQANLYDVAVSVKMLADPAIELNDQVGLYSKYNLVEGGEVIHRPIKREIEYNGMLTETSTFIR